MKKWISIFLFLACFTVLHAEIPERPFPPKLVNDFAGILSGAEDADLEEKLVRFERETSTQIVIVSVTDLEGYDPADYASRLGEKWGVGQQDKDNGIVILVKPKTGNERGRVFIATGYGMEGILPDAFVNGVIVNSEMIPHFSQNNYYRGLDKGTAVLMEVARGEYTADHYNDSIGSDEFVATIIIILIMFFIIVPVFQKRKNRFYSPGKDMSLWTALRMMSGNKSFNGTFNDFSSGGGSFRSSSGGRSGGFGGGRFGGGGAGGSW